MSFNKLPNSCEKNNWTRFFCCNEPGANKSEKVPPRLNVSSNENQSVDLLRKSVDWFLYDGALIPGNNDAVNPVRDIM